MCELGQPHGGVAEWSIALVLKTRVSQGTVSSNLTSSAAANINPRHAGFYLPAEESKVFEHFACEIRTAERYRVSTRDRELVARPSRATARGESKPNSPPPPTFNSHKHGLFFVTPSEIRT